MLWVLEKAQQNGNERIVKAIWTKNILELLRDSNADSWSVINPMLGTVVKASSINIFNPHYNSIWKVLLAFPFYKGGDSRFREVKWLAQCHTANKEQR